MAISHGLHFSRLWLRISKIFDVKKNTDIGNPFIHSLGSDKWPSQHVTSWQLDATETRLEADAHTIWSMSSKWPVCAFKNKEHCCWLAQLQGCIVRDFLDKKRFLHFASEEENTKTVLVRGLSSKWLIKQVNIIERKCSQYSELSEYVKITTVSALHWILQRFASEKAFFPFFYNLFSFLFWIAVIVQTCALSRWMLNCSMKKKQLIFLLAGPVNFSWR